MAYEWTELSYFQKQDSKVERSATCAELRRFGAGVVLVFLVLAGLYESWSLPLAVILVVPMCLLCSLAGVAWPGWTSTSSCRSASWCWSAWRARTPS